MKANEIKAIYTANSITHECDSIISSSVAADFIKKAYEEGTIEYYESCYVLFLNRKNKPLGFSKIADGGIAGCTVDVKRVFQMALLANSSAIMIFHNHPSGNLNPSDADFDITKRLIKAGEVMDISLLDHIIVTSNSHLSMRTEYSSLW
jgi:DNA repair protein RadC